MSKIDSAPWRQWWNVRSGIVDVRSSLMELYAHRRLICSRVIRPAERIVLASQRYCCICVTILFASYKIFDLKLLVISIFSAFISSFIVTNLLIPCGLYSSGFSGICRIATDLFRDFANIELNYAILYFILNLIVCIFTFKYIGKKFALYSAIQFTLTSLFCYFLNPIIEVDDLLLFVIFGGIINGIGCGLCLRYGFSTGGMDFISVYYSSKHNKSFWKSNGASG